MPNRPCAPAEPDAEAGDDLVEHEERAGARAALAQAGEEPGAGRDESHVRGDRLDEDRREVGAVLGERGVERGEVVVRHDDRVGDGAGGHAGRTGQPERRDAAARLHEQRVEVAVVAARELDDLGAAGRAAREAHRGHRGLGARRHEPHLLDRRHARADRFGELDLTRRRRAERRAVGRRPLHRLDDRRIGVAEDRRAPRLHVVEVRRGRRCRRCTRRAPRATKNGSPPTEPNARTGELTPPGMRACARANQSLTVDGYAVQQLGDLAREVREDRCRRRPA